MDTPVDDAIGIVSKWLNESAPLVLSVVTDGVLFSLEGSIISIRSKAFVVARKNAQGEAVCHVTINLERMESIDYHEVREIPPELRGAIGDRVISVLSMRYMGKLGHCCIYELTRSL